MSSVNGQNIDTVRAVSWERDHVRLLDQRILPRKVDYIDYHDAGSLSNAITDMVVRGAPAIGITAAYGVVLAARAAWEKSQAHWREEIEDDLHQLAVSRPTAINLHWAMERMRAKFEYIEGDPIPFLLREARAIQEEDINANRQMGVLGASIIADAEQVLTHCNTGSLATGGYGTALGVIRSAFHAGSLRTVYASETRPWLQGARLTAWELQQDQIPVTIIADSAAGYLLSHGKVKWVIVGADRVAANGDVANKIGTYSLAVTARHHNVRFMVVAPTSTIDRNTACGSDIPIEDRGADEIIQIAGQKFAPENVNIWNPVFDITPSCLIDVLVTEKGVIQRPNREKIATLYT